MPERIISLAPSNTEILFALGLGDKIVGVTTYCDYPPQAVEKPKIGGFSTPDIEKILALEPDLVVAANFHKDTVIPELERRGLNVVLVDPGNIDEAIDSILLVGEKTGTSKEAQRLTSEIRARIKAVTDKVASLSENQKPRTLYITWHDPLWTLGDGTITNELIELAGGVNIFANVSGNSQTDLETVLARNPQVILASTGHGTAEDSPFAWASTEERLSQTDARTNGRVYEVDANLVTRPGPRIAEGLEAIAKLIHPDIFGD